MRLPTIKKRVKRTLEETLEMSLAETSLSLRTQNSLEEGNIWTVGDLLQHSRSQLLEIPNVGPKTIQDIYQALELIGLKKPEQQEQPQNQSWAA
jgi:DNA-directed RNA polymerase subunit alpha